LIGFNNTTKKILHNTNIFSCLVIYIYKGVWRNEKGEERVGK
jgi:hypothetical protein